MGKKSNSQGRRKNFRRRGGGRTDNPVFTVPEEAGGERAGSDSAKSSRWLKGVGGLLGLVFLIYSALSILFIVKYNVEAWLDDPLYGPLYNIIGWSNDSVAIGKPCSDDSNCINGTCDEGTGLCSSSTTGTCSLTNQTGSCPDGQTCQAGQCSPPIVCDPPCQADQHCLFGRCVTGTCGPHYPNGSCPTGKVCRAGTCRHPSPTSGGPPPAQGPPPPSGGGPSPPPARRSLEVGAACESDEQCSSLNCKSGACVSQCSWDNSGDQNRENCYPSAWANDHNLPSPGGPYGGCVWEPVQEATCLPVDGNGARPCSDPTELVAGASAHADGECCILNSGGPSLGGLPGNAEATACAGADSDSSTTAHPSPANSDSENTYNAQGNMACRFTPKSPTTCSNPQ